MQVIKMVFLIPKIKQNVSVIFFHFANYNLSKIFLEQLSSLSAKKRKFFPGTFIFHFQINFSAGIDYCIDINHINI